MKKLLTTLTVLGLLVAFMPAQSQVRVGVQVNIGSQPMWGPAGYNYAEYYYMPDINVYYNIPRQQFVYLDRGRWCFAASLPARYRNFDLYNGYKVVINEPNPYLRADYFRNHYHSYRGWDGRQVVIRDAPRPVPAPFIPVAATIATTAGMAVTTTATAGMTTTTADPVATDQAKN